VPAHVPGTWRGQAGEHAQQARLAAAVRAGEVDRVAGVQGEVDAGEHGAPPAPHRQGAALEQDGHDPAA
jgi:hypothetical protein